MPLIDKPGVYDITAEEYHADPCAIPSLSSSICKTLVNQTPFHAWTEHPRLNPNFERDEDDKFSLGNAAHSLMLGDPKKFAIGPFDDWRKKEAQIFKDTARAEHKIPLLAEQWDRVNEMVGVGKIQLLTHQDASDAFTAGKPEQTLVWSEGDTWFRIRLDWKPDAGDVFYDYKTTESADPDAWQRIVYNVGHDLQAAFYRRGIRKVIGIKNPVMRFVVQETSEPHCLSVVELSKEAMDLADYRVDVGIRKWNWCLARGKWPGYPGKVCVIGPPPWFEGQMLAREERDAGIARAAGYKDSLELLELGMRAQAPI